MTSPKQDNYALDDTLAGRITQAAAVAIMTSYPDWIKNKTALVSAYVLSFLGFGALVAITNAESHEGQPEPEKPEVPLWALRLALVRSWLAAGWGLRHSGESLALSAAAAWQNRGRCGVESGPPSCSSSASSKHARTPLETKSAYGGAHELTGHRFGAGPRQTW